MTHPTDWPPAFTRTTIPHVEQVNGVYPVLEGVRQGRDNLMGGYGYLEWSAAGDAWHEGIDLNSRGGGDADLGALVVAPLGGVVTFAEWWDGRRSGFGSHLALWMDDPKAAAALLPPRRPPQHHLGRGRAAGGGRPGVGDVREVRSATVRPRPHRPVARGAPGGLGVLADGVEQGVGAGAHAGPAELVLGQRGASRAGP